MFHDRVLVAREISNPLMISWCFISCASHSPPGHETLQVKEKLKKVAKRAIILLFEIPSLKLILRAMALKEM